MRVTKRSIAACCTQKASIIRFIPGTSDFATFAPRHALATNATLYGRYLPHNKLRSTVESGVLLNVVTFEYSKGKSLKSVLYRIFKLKISGNRYL